MMRETDEEMETQRVRTVRNITKLELGLVAAMAMNLAAVVWFAATMAAKVDQLSVNVTEATNEIRQLRGQGPILSVLQFRVEQLEKTQGRR